MSEHSVYAIFSMFFYLVGFIPYIYHVFHGRVVPHPFSWTIWCLFSALNLYILFETTGGISWSFASLAIRTIALFIGLACGWYMISKISISRLDYVSLFLALLVLIYVIFYDIRQGIVLMILVDITILIPTLRKIWRDPRTEDAFVWFMAALSQVCLIASLPFLSFENSFFWLYMITINISVGLLINFRSKFVNSTIFKRISQYFPKKKNLW